MLLLPRRTLNYQVRAATPHESASGPPPSLPSVDLSGPAARRSRPVPAWSYMVSGMKSTAPASPAVQRPITELLGYRLRRTSTAIGRSSAKQYRRFGVTTLEWRALALLGKERSLTLGALASMASTDRAQMSRTVTTLVNRRLINRTPAPAATVQLTLTSEGFAIYSQIIVMANKRDQAFRDALTPEELDALTTALAKIENIARGMEESGQVPGDS